MFKNINKNDKIYLVYENGEGFEGFVSFIDNNYLTLHEYVPNVYRTFSIDSIIEVEKI